MCSRKHGSRRAHTLPRLHSERSGFYAFYMYYMGGFSMTSAREDYSAQRRFLRMKFFLQVKHLRPLTPARQPVM